MCIKKPGTVCALRTFIAYVTSIHRLGGCIVYRICLVFVVCGYFCMPQLDSVSYAAQFFWFTVFFLSFYVYCVKTILPGIATSLKFRKAKENMVSDHTDTSTTTVVSSMHSLVSDHRDAVAQVLKTVGATQVGVSDDVVVSLHRSMPVEAQSLPVKALVDDICTPTGASFVDLLDLECAATFEGDPVHGGTYTEADVDTLLGTDTPRFNLY